MVYVRGSSRVNGLPWDEWRVNFRAMTRRRRIERPRSGWANRRIWDLGAVMQSRPLRLAHGWTLSRDSGISDSLVSEFIRPAVRVVPSSMARRLGPCRILLLAEAEAGVTSRWTRTTSGLEVSVTTGQFEEHDIAMELLVCLGQALWERLSVAELRAYWTSLRDEINSGIEGEIEEQALDEKRSLFESRSHANSVRRLETYGCASFAGTAAEYVHSLWHDVSVRSGANYLPAGPLRRRLQLIASWFPPDRGHRLFPPARRHTGPPPSSLKLKKRRPASPTPNRGGRPH